MSGTLSDLAARAGHEVLMVTPDKDYGQLVTEHVRMYRPMQGGGYEIWGEAEIREKFGLDSPAQVIDYLALLGDKVDNIPGCKGIGEKGAQKLLSEYGTVENLLAHASEIKGATGKKLTDERYGDADPFGRLFALRLVSGVLAVAEGATCGVEDDGDLLGILLREEVLQHKDEAEDSAGIAPLAVEAWGFDEGVVGAVDQGVRIEEEESLSHIGGM